MCAVERATERRGGGSLTVQRGGSADVWAVHLCGVLLLTAAVFRESGSEASACVMFTAKRRGTVRRGLIHSFSRVLFSSSPTPSLSPSLNTCPGAASAFTKNSSSISPPHFPIVPHHCSFGVLIRRCTEARSNLCKAMSKRPFPRAPSQTPSPSPITTLSFRVGSRTDRASRSIRAVVGHPR